MNSASVEMFRSLLGTDHDVETLQDARVLVVGAGGIGCELLKNLILSGFRHVHVVDLDTIDPTNLNRQFLFRKQHVGHCKSAIAREAVLACRPNVEIVAHHANIKDPQFNSEFWSSFDLVLNALDNNDARQHVNRLCVSLDIPLIDSGSTGYNGQVTPILNQITSCFECRPLPKPKGYPVCTIRSTPQRPEHCIAWAKYLFEILFGPDNESNVLADLKKGLSSATNDGARVLSRRVFEFAFDQEIVKQAAMPEVWDGKTPPRPLPTESYIPSDPQLPMRSTASSDADVVNGNGRNEREPWTLETWAAVFLRSIDRLMTERAESLGTCVFDKDDPVAVDFVAAASNLRMYNYHIPMISRWEVESIAGAIIPAVASTNAIVAGIQTLQALHLLSVTRRQKTRKTTDVTQMTLNEAGVKHVWVKQHPLGPFLLLPEPLDPPTSTCFVCQGHRMILQLHSLDVWTLEALVHRVILGELHCVEPIIELGASRMCIYNVDMAEDDDARTFMLPYPVSYYALLDFAAKSKLSLRSWNVTPSSSLFVLDYTQGAFECELLIMEDPTLAENKDAGEDPFTFFQISHSRHDDQRDKQSTANRAVTTSTTVPLGSGGKRLRSEDDGLSETKTTEQTTAELEETTSLQSDNDDVLEDTNVSEQQRSEVPGGDTAPASSVILLE